MMARVLYTAEAHVTGGRTDGQGRSSDGALEVDLRAPKELGGEGGGTNPEQLFAVGFASCFSSALSTIARRRHEEIGEVSIDSKVTLGPGDDKSFEIGVTLDVTLPSVSDPAHAADLVASAHEVCPYSNATRGNIEVSLTANGAPVREARQPVGERSGD
jgi:osmotically inducible protein OsmC